MKYLYTALLTIIVILTLFILPTQTQAQLVIGDCRTVSTDVNTFSACESVNTGSLGFKIPSLGDILTFAIRAFFAIAGIAALFYMLIGAFGWVTSGGDKDAISAAREKIQAAVVGMILIVAVLALIWTLEQVIFKRRICLGLSCPVTLPGLIESTTDGMYCCACINRDTNELKDVINTFDRKCNDDGSGNSSPL